MPMTDSSLPLAVSCPTGVQQSHKISGGSSLSLGWQLLAMITLPAALLGAVAVTTHHNDSNRTGANPNETVLTTSNVNVSTFGKLFSRTVDGQIYAQPLYAPNIVISGLGPRNIIYICTEHNSVYAFDADAPGLSGPFWHVNLGPSLPAPVIGSFRDLVPEIGITSTPVIDLPSSTLYVVSETYENRAAIFRIHALDLATGQEKANSPTQIQGSVPGTGAGSGGGLLTFDAFMQWQRPGLLLWNGNLYIAFGSHQDAQPYHGWVFAYDATTLQQTAVRCLSPNASAAGVWQGGVGLAVDANGFIYLQTGHGQMDANAGGSDFGMSVVKLDSVHGLAVVDYFSPYNHVALSADDIDFSSSGPVLIPGTSMSVTGGKDGKLFLLNNSNLGQSHDTDQVVQEWQATYSLFSTGAGGFFGGTVFYNSTLYVWGRRDTLKAFAFNGSAFNTNPVSRSTFTIPDAFSNEPSMSISANGTSSGTGILWAAHSTNSVPGAGNPASASGNPGILHAFDASDLTKELWNSNQNTTRDYSGSWAKWSPPTIANGKVYLATFDNVLNVYGLLGTGIGGGSLFGTGNSSTAPANLTVEANTDWVHWGDGNLNRKAGVSAQIGNSTVIGTAVAITYAADPRPLSWTDGAPAANSTNNFNGVYVPGAQNGLSFTAPADTSSRTLIVHVGGWQSGGTLTAQLSDSSAPDFVSVTPIAAAAYDYNYTLTYKAASALQRLTVSWVMTAGTGNVSLQAAALSSGSSSSASITATGGTAQITRVNTAFPAPLQATVKDANNNPIASATVTFSAPASGPRGTFGGSTTVATAVTNSSGVASAPTLLASSIAGTYTVSATTSGVPGQANFTLTNTVVATSASLIGFGDSSNVAANLTIEGTADWVHWGDPIPNRKAGVSAQISPYLPVGTAAELQYANDPRPLNWTDGSPTISGTNNRSGLYVFGVQNGYSFTVPADSSSRSLIVHVGGWLSGGTLTAHLSDGSAPDFVDISPYVNGAYNRNYTLTFTAAAARQSLTVTWVMSAGIGNGNVSLQAAALAGASISLGGASITATSGTPQSATVNTAFAIPLQVVVKDASNYPLTGITVTFTSPGSGPSGTFGGSGVVTALTNISGVAIAQTFTGNSQAGTFSVLASAPGSPGQASFSLTNISSVRTGSIVGSGNSAASAANLTTEGSLDWTQWSGTGLNRKGGVTSQISNYSVVGSGPALSYNNDPRPISWTDGTLPVTSTNNRSGIFVFGPQNGFSFTALADSNSRTLTVHVGGWVSGGTLTAHLSDGSAADFVDITPFVYGGYDRNYTLTFTAGAAAQTLTVTWVMSAGIGNGNVSLQAAALSQP